MRSFLSSAAVVLLGLSPLVQAADSDVHQLKGDSFKPFIKENDIVLAEFYAPWCGHCKALAPEYEEAATTLKERPEIKLAKIDCTEEATLCQEYGVEGYPTLKVFRGLDKEPQGFSGPRKAQSIVSYLIKQSMPAVSSITSESIEEFKKTDKVVIVAYFEADDKKSNTTYSEAAEELRNDFVFGATNDAALAKAEGIKTPGIILYKDFDEGKSLYTETFAKEEIEKFIRSASIPLIGEIGPDTYAGYMAAQIPLAYIFASTPEERKSFAEELKDIATKHKGAVNFATIDAKQFGAHAANLNLEADKFPAFAIQETVKNQKFPFSQDEKITAASIGKFVDDFVAGKVKPSIKSEATPEKQEGPVYMIVANNYEEIVMNDEADVLVEYYAPWCGHCKALAPKYEELGALYFNKPDFAKKVIIAKVDATLNDVPEEISGFPTIKLFPAGSKSSPLDYSGARTVEGLAEFVKEKGKWQVDGLAGAGKQEDAILPDAEEMGKVPPAASKKAQEAMDTAKDATDKAKATAGSAAEKASDAASSVTEAAGSAASDASEAAATAKESVKGAAQKVAEGVVGGAQAVKEAIKTMAGDGDGDVESSDEL